MILLICNVGLSDVLRYWLNVPVMIFFIFEVIAVLLGIVCGVLTQKKGGNYLRLSLPGLYGCLMFIFINTLGRNRLGDGRIWLTFFAEIFVAFSVAACMVSKIKKQRK